MSLQDNDMTISQVKSELDTGHDTTKKRSYNIQRLIQEIWNSIYNLYRLKVDKITDYSLVDDGLITRLQNLFYLSGTGTSLAFQYPQVYGSVSSPESGDITFDLTNAALGCVVQVIHQSGSTPSFPAAAKQINGSSPYVADGSTLNYIEFQYFDDNTVRYVISNNA